VTHGGSEADRELDKQVVLLVVLLGVGDRDVSPIDAVAKRPQKAMQASGFGRAGAICE
jgi:hypothetical protein